MLVRSVPVTNRMTTAPATQSFTAGLVRAIRPKQWSKNLLVFAAPAAAGVLREVEPFVQSLIAFVAFCLAASGTYLINDAYDVESDRLHPTKRHRPVAAGVIPVGTAIALGLAAVAAGVAVSFAARWELAAVVGGYVVLTTSYTIWLKHIPIVDLVAVAGGFVLRAIAGAAATDVPVSDWFLIIASFGSLFMVAGKRHAELRDLGVNGAAVRSTLDEYTDSYLGYLRAVTSAVVVIAYCLWAIERVPVEGGSPYIQLSIVPFVMGVLRYAMLVDRGEGAAPEDLVLTDRTLQIFGVIWAVSLVLAVYVT